MSTEPAVAAGAERGQDFMPMHGIDHIELWVGNAAQAAYFYTRALGFQEVAYAGLETGQRDRVSHVLEQGRIRLVLTGALTPDHEIGRHAARHGDGVKVIALSVPDAEYAYQASVARGARGVREPWELSDEHGTVKLATIATYGETLHTFVQRDGYGGAFMPGYMRRDIPELPDTGLLAIDHVVGNVELGAMETWVKFYEDVFGMTEMIHFSDEEISTEYSALMSKVVTDGNGRIKFPINEPAEGKRKSQIDEYLEFYGGAGAQHIAGSSSS
jgi:4-hydroxyphenylpyruvate dioxygenase